jgi:hypothetical protein
MQRERNRAGGARIPCLAPVVSVALLMASTSASAAVGSPLTPVIEVSPDPASPPARPENWIARDALGNFAVAWSVGSVVDDPEAYIRWFAADGTPLTAAMSLPDRPLGLGMDDAGDAVVVYQCGQPESFPVTYCAQTYSSSGIPISPEITYAAAVLSDTAQINLQGTSVGMSGSGDFTVAWAETDIYQNYDRQLAYTRTYHLDGAAVAPANTTVFDGITVGPYNGGGHAEMGSIAVAHDGSYAVAASVLGYGTKYQVKFFNKKGAPTTLTISIPLGPNPTTASAFPPSMAIAPNGDVLLAFYTSTGTISVYRYWKTGFKKLPPFTAFQAPEGHIALLGPLALSTTSDNGFMLTYGDFVIPDVTSPSDESVVTQVYNANSQLQTTFNDATLTVPAATAPPPINTVTDPSNNLTVVWGTVKAQVFQGP